MKKEKKLPPYPQPDSEKLFYNLYTLWSRLTNPKLIMVTKILITVCFLISIIIFIFTGFGATTYLQSHQLFNFSYEFFAFFNCLSACFKIHSFSVISERVSFIP